MIYMNITDFGLITKLEKNHSVVETCRFVLSKKIL